MKQILFMEDEPTIQDVLTEYMQMQGYIVTLASDGEEALAFLENQKFDMAVLDILVPKIDGLSVLSNIKEQHPDMAIIMLTALEDETTQLKAFNLYADDYVIKPVSPIILLKRMETILRRVKKEESKDEHGLILHKEAFQAFYNGSALPLTLSEFLLIEALKDYPNKVFTREQLILRIFNEDYIGNDRIIDAHIKNLRKKLPYNYVKTVIGVGYQYNQNAEQQLM